MLPSLQDVADKLKQHGRGRIALDIETYDPDIKKLGPGVRRDGRIVGVALALEGGASWYLPIDHEPGGNLPKDKTLALLRRWAKGYKGTIVGANLGGYDLDYLAEAGVHFNRAAVFKDVQLAEPLLDEHRFTYALDDILFRHLKLRKNIGTMAENAVHFARTKKEQTDYAKEPQKVLWRMPPEQVEDYALGDVLPLFDLLNSQEHQLRRQDLDQVWELETRLVPMVLAMTRRGVPVNLRKARQAQKAVIQRRDELIAELSRRGNCEIKLWVPDTLAPVLEASGITLPRTPKTNKPSITAAWLESCEAEEAALILEARKLDKTNNTFFEGHIFGSEINGRVYCRWHQMKSDDGGTISGRFSCSDPNLQNVSARSELSKVVRECFVPEKGEEWVKDDLCLTGDTMIITIDGNLPLREVVNNPRPVLAFDNVNKRVRFQNVLRTIKLPEKQHVYEITMVDGSTARATAEHRWFKLDGSLVRTSDLTVGMRLEHVHDNDMGVPAWYVRSHRRYQKKHMLVSNFAYGPPPDGYEVDHIDADKNNWARSNLRYLPIPVNRAQGGQRYWKAVKEGHRSDDLRLEKLREGLKRRRSYSGENNPNWGKRYSGTTGRKRTGSYISCAQCGKSVYQKLNGNRAYCSTACYHNACRTGVAVQCQQCGTPIYQSFCGKRKYCSRECYYANNHNHKVASIKYIGKRRVYCLEVESDNNFVLANGMVSHNSQIEFRLLVHYARHPSADAAREAYWADPTTSFHKMAGDLAGMDWRDDYIYKRVKATNFCKVYGGGATKIALTAGISFEEAQAFVELYDARLPFVKDTNRWANDVAQERGYVFSLSGRRHRFPLWEPRDYDLSWQFRDEGIKPTANKAHMESLVKEEIKRVKAISKFGIPMGGVKRYRTYKALNDVLQGGGTGDLPKEAMARQWESGVCDVLGPPLLQVHDEEGWSRPRTKEALEASEEAKDIFRQVGESWELRVPILMEREVGRSWGSTKKIK